VDHTCVIYCLAIDGEVQRLRGVAAAEGWTVAALLTDSPATAPKDRVGFRALERLVAGGEVRTILVPSLTMLSAGVGGLVKFVAKLAADRINLFVEKEGIDSRTPEGAGWIAAVASLHQFDRAQKQQAAMAGLLRARDAGVRLGRPPVNDGVVQRVRAALASGHGIRPTARKLGISPARVHAEKLAMSSAENFLYKDFAGS
jgi:DNA invertase Pin-like site-specific DNA recombinase